MFRFVIVLMVGVVTPTSGQDSLASLIPRSAIKFSPLHMFNFYPTIQIAYEHHISGNFTAQLDAGVVLNFNDVSERFQNKRGFKSKLEVRYYFRSRDDRDRVNYFAFEPYYYRINFDRTSQGPPECLDADCTVRFVRNYDYMMMYREKGFTFKVGSLKYYDSFFTDFNFGITNRFVDYDSSLPLLFPEGNPGWFPIPNEEDRRVISPHIGIRFGVRLK